ncbi:MAG TPA: glycosyltransferase family 4 protein [Bacillales bacterium]|nr:glycosyltransferase family 4 protein [Bacillales bacterium]
MQRLWILSELYFPVQTSTGYFITKISEELAKEYSVKIITISVKNYSQYEVINNVEIFRCKSILFDKNFFLGRLVNLVSHSVSIFWKALFSCQQGDFILVVTNPPLLPFIALIIKWIKRCNIVLLIHDVYPEVLVAVGLCKPSSIIVKVGQMMNRVLYNHTCKIITLGRDMTQLVKVKLTNPEEKIYCIPNWTDNEIVTPTERTNNSLLQKLEVAERFVVLYAGNMGITHSIESLAKAANILQSNPNIYFVFVGFGAKRKWLEDYVILNKIKNISIINPYPRSELIVVLNACDVALISFVPGMAGVSVPSRMYNQMAAGKPIIAVADDSSELAEVVREEKIGWIVKPGNVKDLIHTIQLAADNRKLCAQMGARAAMVAKNKYTLNQTVQAYQRLFKELVTFSQYEADKN